MFLIREEASKKENGILFHRCKAVICKAHGPNDRKAEKIERWVFHPGLVLHNL